LVRDERDIRDHNAMLYAFAEDFPPR